jgi:hypothetical protein
MTAQMKLNLSTPLTDLDGKAIDNLTLGKVLANALSSASSGPAIKFMDWALTLHREGTIDVDAADLDTLKSFVDKASMSNLARGPILKAIASCPADNAPRVVKAITE